MTISFMDLQNQQKLHRDGLIPRDKQPPTHNGIFALVWGGWFDNMTCTNETCKLFFEQWKAARAVEQGKQDVAALYDHANQRVSQDNQALRQQADWAKGSLRATLQGIQGMEGSHWRWVRARLNEVIDNLG